MENNDKQRKELLKEIIFKLIELNPQQSPTQIIHYANEYLDFLEPKSSVEPNVPENEDADTVMLRTLFEKMDQFQKILKDAKRHYELEKHPLFGKIFRISFNIHDMISSMEAFQLSYKRYHQQLEHQD